MHDKERSRTIRSYLIRHQSSLLLQTMIQVNYLDLGRICSSARKWLFFSPVRGLPILDHVVLFCRLVLGAYGVSDAGRDHRVHAHLPPRLRARISLLHFHRILATDPSGKQLRTRPLPVNVFFFLSALSTLHRPRRPHVPHGGPSTGNPFRGAPDCKTRLDVIRIIIQITYTTLIGDH